MRRHVAVDLHGPAAAALDALRAQWDPVMRRRAPAHVTVVYPEETVDGALLAERLAEAAAELAPFPLRLGPVTAAGGGVLVTVDDPSGTLTTLRDRLLLPPQRPLGVPFHATVAHPRTAARLDACRAALHGHDLAPLAVEVGEVLRTATGPEGRTVLARHRLAGAGTGREVMAGAVLVDGTRVLLGRRRADRARAAGVWDVPGGRVEPGESPRAAVARELGEELGVTVEPGAPWTRLVDDGLGVELWLWVVREWAGVVRNAAAEEHDELRWCDPAELAALPLAHPSYPALLRRALTAG